MKRRDFVKSGLALSGSALATVPGVFASGKIQAVAKHDFKLKYAPHFGMFKNHAGEDPIDQLKFMADTGFKALEDNGLMKRDVKMQEKIGSELARRGMDMGVFVIDGGDNWKISLTTGKQEFSDNFVNTCKKAVEVAKRVNATWMTVVPGFFERKIPIGIQTSNVVEALRRGAEIFEPHGLVMVLEPLSDTPELFLRFSDQTFEICKAVNSPSCKILYDIYHMQRNEGDLIRRMEATWDEIAYIQIGDNPGRKEPTTGEINYKNVFEYIYNKGYRGVLGMEHGNSEEGKEGEIKLINAYAEVDKFRV
ncbi:MAG: hydroxypyruvate isomerase family protein [Cyclobacteriaceae bacterium]